MRKLSIPRMKDAEARSIVTNLENRAGASTRKSAGANTNGGGF